MLLQGTVVVARAMMVVHAMLPRIALECSPAVEPQVFQGQRGRWLARLGRAGSACLLLYSAVFITCWNIGTLQTVAFPRLWIHMGVESLAMQKAPAWLSGLGMALRMPQDFLVFAPRPPMEDSWIVIPGTLRDKRPDVDILRLLPCSVYFGSQELQPPAFDEPQSHVIRNQRWHKYFRNYIDNDLGKARVSQNAIGQTCAR